MKTMISGIKIGSRIRKDLGDIEVLKKSLEKHGLIHPVIINSKGELIAGFRRITAAQQLGWKEIETNVIDPPKEIDFLEMEMEENMARKDFTYEELMIGLEKKKKLLNPGFFGMIWNFLKKLFRLVFGRK
jgi:ParB family transcriptional regulator, chromosome partitioning protein